MSQRDFNNNTGNTTEIFNTISLLPTKTDVNTSIVTNNLNYTTTSGINTLLSSTIASQVIARDLAVTTAINNNNLNYTTSLLLATLINNNIITNNILYTNITNLNILLANAVTSRDAAIALSSSNNNTLSTAYTNTKINTEITRADAAIATNNVNNLALIKTYTVDQNFTNINLSGKLYITAIGDGTTQYGYNSSAGNQCVAIGISANSGNGQINSTCVGHNSKCVNGYGVSIGCYSCSNAVNCVAIGYNAGNQSNVNNTGCIYIGSNANINYTTTHTNSVCIGIGSKISQSNCIFLGRDLLDTTVCYALNTTNLTGTTATINNLNLNGTTTFNYSSLSGLASYKNQGFSSSTSTLKNIYAYDTVYNCNTITLPCGVYFINYKFELNYTVTMVNYWLNFGLGSSGLLLDLQQNKVYSSSAGNITSTYNCSNSYCFVSTNGSVVYQNVMLNAFDNTIPIANLSSFIISAKMTAIRLA